MISSVEAQDMLAFLEDVTHYQSDDEAEVIIFKRITTTILKVIVIKKR